MLHGNPPLKMSRAAELLSAAGGPQSSSQELPLQTEKFLWMDTFPFVPANEKM